MSDMDDQDTVASDQKQTEELARKATRGIFWSGAGQTITQAISFAVNIVVARLLFPEDFGILGMAAMFTELVGMVGDLGLNSAVVQREKIAPIHLFSCFWVNMLVAVTLVGLSIIGAPFVAQFFEKEIVGPVIIVSSLGFILRSFGSVHRAVLTRDLEFKKLAMLDILPIMTFSVLVIPMAWSGMGLWSVVIANLVGAFVSTVMLWILCDWRPAWRFEWRSCRELMSFGLNVLGEQTLDYVNLNVDYLLIGRILGAVALGVYTLAFNLMTYPLRKIAQVVTRVTFPTFSRVQGDNAVLQSGYLKTVRYISLATFPILTGLGLIAPDFIRLVYGEKWNAAIIPLQIMCLDGLVRTISTTTGSILYAKGRADIGFKWKIVTVLVIPPFILIGAQYGIIGVSIAVAVATLILSPIIQVVTNNLIELRMRRFLAALLPAAVGSVIMVVWVIGLLWARSRFVPTAEYSFLTTVVVTAAGVYALSFRVLFRDMYTEIFDMVRHLRG